MPKGHFVRGLTLEERFWGKVDKSGDCWPWTGNCLPNGYGVQSTSANKYLYAHRLAWEIASGERPDGYVLHICDTPRCVRNDDAGTYLIGEKEYPRFGHLVLGDAAANSLDMKLKGRGRSRAKLMVKATNHPDARTCVHCGYIYVPRSAAARSCPACHHYRDHETWVVVMKNFGVIQRERQLRNVDLVSLIHMSESEICHRRNGQPIRMERAREVAAALGVTVDYLLGMSA